MINELNQKRRHGFTLVEIIASLVILSVLGAFMIQLTSAVGTCGSSAIITVKQRFELAAVMEKMLSDYKWLLLTNITPLETLRVRIENGNNPANTPYFGDYDISTKFINFTSNGTNYEEDAVTCATDCKTLKVVLSHENQRLTALFTN